MLKIPVLPISLALVTSLATAHESKSSPEEKIPAVEICFVLDTTGSMGGLIESAKRKIWSIANEAVAFKPKEIRFGIVAYRDRGDQYVTANTKLTNDLDAVHTKLMSLKANGGGDFPESVNQALHEGITKMHWSKNPEARKILFLVGDAPPHMNYQDDTKYSDTLALAKEKGIYVNAILCGSHLQTATIWKEIAEGGKGHFAAIPQDGGAAVVSTPYDTRLNQLSVAQNCTIVCWGDQAQQKAVREKVTAINKSSVETQATRAGYANSNFKKGQVITGKGDLVNDWSTGKIKLEDIKPEQLEGELEGLSGDALVTKLKAKQAEREKIAKEVAELTRKRTLFLKNEAKKNKGISKDDSFDAKVAGILKAQLGATEK